MSARSTEPARVLRGATGLAIVIAIAALMTPALAQTQAPILARDQIVIAGLALKPTPEHQTVPRNIATSVTAQLVASSDSATDASSAIPSDAVVYAELRGPAFGTPVTLIARPGQPLKIQPLAMEGTYLLENIRLVSGGTTFLQAMPDTVTIDVIDKVLVSQVSTRALTAKEIQQKGIFVDQTNFDVVNFTAAFGIQGGQKTIDFPIVLPKRPSASLPASPPTPSLPPLSPTAVLPPAQALPQLQQVFQTNNVSVSGLVLKIEDEEIDRQFTIPPIPGVIIIPGNIAFLHQFFSVLLLVSNVAPGASHLIVRDVSATIVLPPGADTVAGSDDDPLKMARTGNPPVEQSTTQAVAQPGPDGKLGTADDVLSLSPGENGNSEFLVEGRKEGTHTVQIQIHAMLDGLPIGPVKISGFATGIVEVRNPTFSLTLSHPATVMAGDPYDLLVTVTNTSDTPANLVSVNLSPNSISGALLDSDQSVTLDTIAARDAATATFHLISQQTGNVTATSFTSDDAPGKFILRTSVGALGIPPSPNSLVLPPAADGLPAALKMAGISLLGQAYALATSPVVPAGLKGISPQIVYERATNLTQAGQRIQMGDVLARVGEDLALDVLGNGFTRIAERFPGDAAAAGQAQLDYQGFDTLSRQSPRGATFMKALADVFRPAVQASGALAFQRDWASDAASRPPFISVIAGLGGGGAPVVLRMIGPDGRQVGMTTAGGPIVRDLAFSGFLPLMDSAPTSSQLIVDAVPTPGTYRIELNGTGDGAFDLGIVVPAGDHLRQLTYAGVPIVAGARASLTLSLDGSDPTLSIDDDRDGAIDRTLAPSASETIVDSGPTAVGAVQIVTGSPDLTQFGQVVGLLFSEEISTGSAELIADGMTRFRVDANQVLGASLQPGGRVLLLSLRDGVGPFVARSITVSSVADRLGHPMSPQTATVPVVMTIDGHGAAIAGRVRAADGTPIHNARLQLSQRAPVATSNGALAGLGDLAAEKEVTVTVKDLDATGRYSFDYVRQFGSAGEFVRLQAVNLDTGESGEVITQFALPGRHLDVDIIFIGTGTLVGRALAPDGTPLAGAVIRVSSLTRLGQAFGAAADASGVYSIAGIPAGNFTIEAVHVATNSRTLQAGSIPAAGATVVQNLTLIPLGEVILTTGGVKGQIFHASDGTPASGVPVFTDRGGLATTDAAGNYRIDTLPTGPVTIKAIDQARFEQGSTVALIASGADSIANVLLVGGAGTIQGVVVDATDHPVPNAVVGGGLALVRTNAAGAFVLGDVPIGTRTISALDESTGTTASASVTLSSAGETANVKIRLPGQGSIAGRVFEADGATPIPNVKVLLLGGFNQSSVTNANGGYRFDRLPLGAYKVSAFKDGFSDGNVVDTKVVFQGEVRTTNVVARGKGRVTGVVLAADGQTPLGARVGFSELTVATGTLTPLDNPACLGDIEVGDTVIELPKCQPVAIGFASTPITRLVDTDVSSGAFTFDNVFVGGFTVEAANAFSPAIMRAAGAITHPGETVPVVLKLQATSVVKGVVYQPGGVTPAGKSVVVTFNSGTLSNVNVITDEHGAYVFPLVNPGQFSVTASDPAGGLVGRSDGAVDAGATANVSIRLLSKGPVKVNVTGSNGVVADAVVTVTRGTFPNDRRQGVTRADGSIAFAGGDALTEGPFGVSAFDPASGITGFGSGTVSPATGDTIVSVRLDDQTGTVHGRFVMPDGATVIPNAQVRVSSARGQAFATTDSDGRFGVDGAFGNFAIEAFDPVTARRGRATGTIAINHQDVTVDVVAGAQGTVKGVVRFSKDGNPVTAADVTLSVDSPFAGQLVTSSGVDGSFTFPGVAAGALAVSARDPSTGLWGSATSVLGVEGEVVDVIVVVQVPKLGRVQGTIRRADGSAAFGAHVTLSTGVQTTVDGNGSYSVNNVPVGRVSVTASAPVGHDGGVGSGDLAFDGDVATVDVTFIGTGSVTSTVRSATGVPVPFATVALTSRNVLQSVSLAAESDDNGGNRFDGVPVGDVSVTAVDTATNLAGSASGRLAADGARLDLSIVLQPAGSLTARVFRQDRATPAVGLAVELSGQGLQGQRFGSTSTDGSVSFDNLPLGPYQLLVTDPLGTGIVKGSAVIGQAGQIVDLGTLILDEAAPRVVRIGPADGSAGVPVTQAIEVLFSEAIDQATVTTDTIRVATPAGPVPGVWTVSSNRTTATFVATGSYRDFTPVSIKVTTAVTDLVGKPLSAEATSAFTTADSTPPVIVGRTPSPGARGVGASAVVRIGYSEAIDPARFTGQPIALSLDNAAIDGRIDFALGNTAIVFTPTAPLSPNGTYRVVVQPASDVFGNREAIGSTFSFSTLDTIAPAVDALAMAGGDRVKVGGVLTATASVSASDVALVELLVNGAVVQSRSAAPFTFSLPVTASLAPSFTLSARATDLSGNVGDARSLTIAVDPDLPPTATITAPADGTIVRSGTRFFVAVHAADDTGVARVGFQATGAAATTASLPVDPPSLTKDVSFPVDVPADAAGGSRIDLRVAAIDTLGQSSASSSLSVIVADVTPPTVRITSPAASAQVDPGQTLAVTVVAEDSGGVASVTLQASGAVTFTELRTIAPAQSATQTVFDIAVPSAARPTERVTLTATAVDVFGNAAAPATLAIAVHDVVAPAVTLTIDGGMKEIQPGRALTFSVSATDEGGVSALGFEASGAVTRTGSQTIAPAQPSAAGQFSLIVPAAAPVGGSIAIVGSATDATGNVGRSAPATLAVVADNPPSVRITAPVSGASVTEGSTLTITADAADDVGVATVEFTVNGAVVATRTFTPYTAQAVVPSGSDGSPIVVQVTAIDTAGHTSTDSVTLTLHVDSTPPRVSAIAPADKSVDVSIATPIDVTFTEPLDPASVTADSVRVILNGAPAGGALSLLAGDTAVRFTPSQFLPLDSPVVVELFPAITDRFGNALVDADGHVLTGPLTFTFATGTFAIVNPSPNASVIEMSRMIVEARGSAALGIVSVLFSVNGVALPAAGGPLFTAAFDVPARTTTQTLTIVATARDGAGRQIATDQVTVNVSVGLQATPSIVGMPTGGSGSVRLSLTSALTQDLPISFAPIDPTVVTPPSAATVLRAGQTSTSITIGGASIGNTTVLAHSDQGSAAFIVSVSDPVAQQTLTPVATPAAIAVRTPPVAAQVFASGGVANVTARLTSAPVASDTAVVVTSSDDSIARVSGTPIVRAGQRVAALSIATGAPGIATLTIRAGGDVVRMLVIVGDQAAATTAALASPVGMSIVPTRTAGQLFTPAGGRHTITIRLLGSPAAVDTPVSITTSNAAVASLDGTSIVRAGQQVATVTIVSGASGVATLTFNAGGEVRVMDVNVGASPTAAVSPIVARPVGVAIAAPPSVGRLIADMGRQQTIGVRLLSHPSPAAVHVDVSSSNPSVASVALAGDIPAGGQISQLTIETGASGVATLILRAGNQVSELTIVVGSADARAPAIVAPPVGISITQPPQAGLVIAPQGAVSIVGVRLLGTPATHDIVVDVSSSNPSVATVQGPVVIHAGEQIAQIGVTTTSAGAAVMTMTAGGQTVRFTVISGTAAPGDAPVIVAPVVGVKVQQ